MHEDEADSLLKRCRILACGTLQQEVRRLADEGTLDGERLLFTAPGLHEWPRSLEKQLVRQLEKACSDSEPVIVIYGESCYYDFETSTDTDGLLARFGPRVARVRAKYCVSMLAGTEERSRVADGARVYWFTPGWIEHWDFIFQDWDIGKANETFPGNDKAVILDALGYYDRICAEDPEKLLRISDWMKLPIEAHAVSLQRLTDLLQRCAEGLLTSDAGPGRGGSAAGRGPQ
jgi:hypothetical protein